MIEVVAAVSTVHIRLAPQAADYKPQTTGPVRAPAGLSADKCEPEMAAPQSHPCCFAVRLRWEDEGGGGSGGGVGECATLRCCTARGHAPSWMLDAWCALGVLWECSTECPARLVQPHSTHSSPSNPIDPRYSMTDREVPTFISMHAQHPSASFHTAMCRDMSLHLSIPCHALPIPAVPCHREPYGRPG